MYSGQEEKAAGEGWGRGRRREGRRGRIKKKDRNTRTEERDDGRKKI